MSAPRSSSRPTWPSPNGRASSATQDLQAATIRDGVVSHVTVTDRHHALCGQLLPLVSLRSARDPAYIVVALPDGRRRSLRRMATDLAGTAEAPLYDGPLISVGTLLPLIYTLFACDALPV